MNITFKILLSVLLVSGTAASTVKAEAPKNGSGKAVNSTLAKPVADHSVFKTPTNVREGRDPFFPDSSRVYDAAAQVNPNRKVDATSLVFKGVSVIGGRRYVIINNHTFTGGDEGDVLTATGRAHVKCVEIRSDSVVVEINGQRHVLSFNSTGQPRK